jgi:peptidoglycan/xylan/chitin deacetylase (PgdA/CDA1 family)
MVWSDGVDGPLTRRALVAGAAAAALSACAGRRTGTATPTTAPSGTGPSQTPPARQDAETTTTTTTHVAGDPARFVQSGPTKAKAVALTFHVAGDSQQATALFDEAHRLGVPLTLFLVGTFVDANPALVRRLASDGHELANHTATHPTLGRLARAAVAKEIAGGRDAIERAAKTPGAWFRPSGMDVPTPVVLAEAGRAGYATVVGYDLDPHDYQDPGRAAVVERVRNGIHGGSIVSLHTAHQGTIDAFPDIVDLLRTAQLAPVTVSKLLTNGG